MPGKRRSVTTTVERIHLVRHGEVENPGGVVYGRLPGFSLSERGHRQAAAAARALVDSGAQVTDVFASPLTRTLQSAEPIAARFGLEVVTDDKLLEATSRLEGKQYDVSLAILSKPQAWRYLVNPFRPSWGEPYIEVLARMNAAIADAMTKASGREIVIVSHQLPIWVVRTHARGQRLYHDPRRRRCALSSVTTFDVDAGRLVEVDYLEQQVD